MSVSRRLASRLRYVVKRRGKETKENNFSIHKNLQNIRKKYKNKNPYESKKKRSKKSIYKEKHRKMLQLMRKKAEQRKKMKNSEKKIVKEDGENKHV